VKAFVAVLVPDSSIMWVYLYGQDLQGKECLVTLNSSSCWVGCESSHRDRATGRFSIEEGGGRLHGLARQELNW